MYDVHLLPVSPLRIRSLRENQERSGRWVLESPPRCRSTHQALQQAHLQGHGPRPPKTGG